MTSALVRILDKLAEVMFKDSLHLQGTFISESANLLVELLDKLPTTDEIINDYVERISALLLDEFDMIVKKDPSLNIDTQIQNPIFVDLEKIGRRLMMATAYGKHARDMKVIHDKQKEDRLKRGVTSAREKAEEDAFELFQKRMEAEREKRLEVFHKCGVCGYKVSNTDFKLRHTDEQIHGGHIKCYCRFIDRWETYMDIGVSDPIEVVDTCAIRIKELNDVRDMIKNLNGVQMINKGEMIKCIGIKNSINCCNKFIPSHLLNPEKLKHVCGQRYRIVQDETGLKNEYDNDGDCSDDFETFSEMLKLLEVQNLNNTSN